MSKRRVHTAIAGEERSQLPLVSLEGRALARGSHTPASCLSRPNVTAKGWPGAPIPL